MHGIINSSIAPSLFLSDYLKQAETSWPTILAAKTIAKLLYMTKPLKYM